MNYKQEYKNIPRGYKNLVREALWDNENTGKTMIKRWTDGKVKDLELISMIELVVEEVVTEIEFARTINCNLTDVIRCTHRQGFNMIEFSELRAFKMEIDNQLHMDFENESKALNDAKETLTNLHNTKPFELKLLIAKYILND